MRLCSTALFRTLCSVLSQGRGLVGIYDASPDISLLVPTVTDISARWSGVSSEQIEAIVEDYNFERDNLGELELEDIYNRVKELALEHTTFSS